jgi:hypothetical protein
MISQGASEINISFVIEEKNVPETVQRLHKLLFPRQRNATAVQGDAEDEAAVETLAHGAEGKAAAEANAD